ncbi:hypothetical protein AB0H76_15160 [Nocardia sp. NPDC050712]|uniref:hypothetical protein n=1 Tax=Nocardia sp. NPDC050712 TaxID=3155518 RepID=UPI0033D8EBBF
MPDPCIPTDDQLAEVIATEDWTLVDPRATVTELVAARARIAELERERDTGYRGRAEVLAVLAQIFPSQMPWPEAPGDWPVLFLTTPEGQVSWHINPGDLDLFDTDRYAMVNDEDPGSRTVWDGHTTKQKSDRLHRLATCYQPADLLVEQHEIDVARARIAELEGALDGCEVEGVEYAYRVSTADGLGYRRYEADTREHAEQMAQRMSAMSGTAGVAEERPMLSWRPLSKAAEVPNA